MPKTKTASLPDTRLLRGLMQDYLDMLREAECGVKKVLALDPNTEEFWDELDEATPLVTQVGDRSNSIWEEVLELIDQLPDD